MALAQNIVDQIGNSTTTLLGNQRFIDTAIAQVTITPENFQGIAGFVFDIIESDTLRLQSSITDHYTEDNQAIQNQVAQKPLQFTIRGLVGESVINDIGILPEKGSFRDKLTNITAYLPGLTGQTLQALRRIDKVREIKKRFDDNENLFSIFKDLLISPRETRQAKAFGFFYALWGGTDETVTTLSREAPVPFTVDTPWHTFTNMMILDLKATQGPDSKEITSFEITFKQLRFAKTILVQTAEERLAHPQSVEKDKGKTQGPRSVLFKIFNFGKRLLGF